MIDMLGLFLFATHEFVPLVVINAILTVNRIVELVFPQKHSLTFISVLILIGLNCGIPPDVGMSARDFAAHQIHTSQGFTKGRWWNAILENASAMVESHLGEQACPPDALRRWR